MNFLITANESPRPEHTALVAETRLTFGTVWSRAGGIAHALQAAGLEPGDRVAVATAHKTSFYCSFAACFAAGLPVAVLDPSAAPRELALMLEKAAPAALVADAAVLEQLSNQTSLTLPDSTWYAGLRDRTQAPGGWFSALLGRSPGSPRWPFLAEIPASKEAPEIVSVSDDAPAYIMFTSGTTSKPKGVVVSRAALRHHVGTLSRVFGYRVGATLLCYLPTHHTDGLVHGVAASLFTGMTAVHPGRFSQSVDVEKVLRANRISHFLTVPTMLAMIRQTFSDRPELFRYEQFQHLVSTAGYLDERLWGEFRDHFHVRISNFYGMTETVSGTLYCGPDDSTFRFGTLGKPVDADVRIVDQNGDVVPANTIGELQISGSHLMTGYLDDPDATRAAITGGWLSTGDLFCRDDDGFFHFTGRLKNIIKRGGISVYPEDIRNVISTMPGILEAEVIGLPDPVFEEVITACAVAETGVTTEKIRAFCRDRLAPERRPDRIELMDRLPRGPSGKVMRDALVASLSERGGDIHERRTGLRAQVIEVAAKVFSVTPAELNEASSPETVDDWDSYANMELVLALEERFVLRLGPKAIMQMRNIGKVIEVVTAEVGAEDAEK